LLYTQARWRYVLCFVTLLACRRSQLPSTDIGTTSASAGGTPPNPRADDACTPLRLGLHDAHPVARWNVPEGCGARGGASEPHPIRSEAEFTAEFQCPSGVRAGIDFTAQTLWVSMRSLSPAGVGFDVVDDGHTVTFIGRMRAPCPSDPRPMPTPPSPYAFVLPVGSTRTMAQTSCTMQRSCP
jgi:hypothetical protein